MKQVEIIQQLATQTKLAPEWPSEELRDYVEYLQQKIAEAMYIPPHLLRPETHNELVARAYARTEVMRRELTKLTMEHCWPKMVVPDV